MHNIYPLKNLETIELTGSLTLYRRWASSGNQLGAKFTEFYSRYPPILMQIPFKTCFWFQLEIILFVRKKLEYWGEHRAEIWVFLTVPVSDAGQELVMEWLLGEKI